MIVWGGTDGNSDFNTGGRYDPSMDSWTATSITNAPTERADHAAVWTGSEMIVWGGDAVGIGGPDDLRTGGRYNPGTDSWTATSTTDAPTARDHHTAVWTGSGSEMIVWGGEFFDGAFHVLNTGGRYNPDTDSWTATSTINAPTGRASHTAVWTGNEMIVWGGVVSGETNTGGRYNPGMDSWMVTTTTNAPSARAAHAAVWTDTEMIVWGGEDGERNVNTGGRYCAQAASPTIMLSAGRHKGGRINTVRLNWREATSTDIDVYRDGTLIVTTPNDGFYIDATGDSGRARYTYQVCEAGSQTCSDEATVSFPR